MADGLLEAVRGLHLAHPELGPKPLLAKLRERQPDLAVGNKEVREALAALTLNLVLTLTLTLTNPNPVLWRTTTAGVSCSGAVEMHMACAVCKGQG